MKTYITEIWLRENHRLTEGTELHLPASSVLTPAASSLLSDRHIRVKYVDEQGQIFVKDATKQGQTDNNSTNDLTESRKKVHPLTTDDQHHASHCILCEQTLQKKPETLTHLDAVRLVSKNDPRLHFRSKVDATIALAVWLQVELDATLAPQVAGWLADIRSILGNVLRSEVTGDVLHPVHMGDFDDQAIHKMSHNPLKYLGHDHIVPEAAHGLTVVRLNLLRTAIRETEILAAQIFIDQDFVVKRPDIMQGLNRLSSAVYVLMITILVLEKKQRGTL